MGSKFAPPPSLKCVFRHRPNHLPRAGSSSSAYLIGGIKWFNSALATQVLLAVSTALFILVSHRCSLVPRPSGAIARAEPIRVRVADTRDARPQRIECAKLRDGRSRDPKRSRKSARMEAVRCRAPNHLFITPQPWPRLTPRSVFFATSPNMLSPLPICATVRPRPAVPLGLMG